MTETSRAQLDMTIVLPLGVVASQLLRIEAQLRVLNMKALNLESERDNSSLAGPVGVRLEQISDALDALRTLVAEMQADMQPRNRKRHFARED